MLVPFIELGNTLLHRRVPVVLDRVISAPTEILGNLSPSVPKCFMGKVKQPLLVITPLFLLD